MICCTYLLGFNLIPDVIPINPVSGKYPLLLMKSLISWYFVPDDSLISLDIVISGLWSKIPKPGADWSMLRDSPSGAPGRGRYETCKLLRIGRLSISYNKSWLKASCIWNDVDAHANEDRVKYICHCIHKFWSCFNKWNKEFHFWECPPLTHPQSIKWQH